MTSEKYLPRFYVLGPDGRTPIREKSLLKWARWFATAERHVAATKLPGGIGWVSTIFLGVDHSFGRGRPVLFETMSFLGDEHEDYFDRYCTWDEAETGHAAVVARALADIEHAAALAADALVPGGETT